MKKCCVNPDAMDGRRRIDGVRGAKGIEKRRNIKLIRIIIIMYFYVSN